MNKTAFKNYIYASNQKGSGKAASYVRALDLLEKMLAAKPFSFADCQDIWAMTSIDRLQELYDFAKEQTRKAEASEWNLDGLPVSYLRDGYCSAALKSLQEFLVEHQFEQDQLDVFNKHTGDEDELTRKLTRDLKYPKCLLEELENVEGKEKVRTVRTRSNQNVFRKIILMIYNQSCCITGLDIPEVNRASHIIPWAKDKSKRMDPRNGLCLSATYDAAFDRSLISLDDDYRIILSRDIKDHYTKQVVKEHFHNKEGNKITLPNSYLPKKEYLEEHRKLGSF